MRLSRLLLASTLVLAPIAAHATDFTITSGSDTLTFSAPSNPSSLPSFGYDVSPTDPTVADFTFSSPAIFDGSAVTDSITFYTTDDGGGLVDNYFNVTGVQLFSGSVESPTLIGGDYTIVNGAISATPEPSSLILLGTGVLGLAGAARRRLSK